MKTEYDVIIVGGGPAGLALSAYLSHHCPKISYIVLEKSTMADIKKQTRTGYDLSPSGTKALARLNNKAFENTVKRSFEYKRIEWLNSDGKPISCFDIDSFPQFNGLPLITVQRSQLMISMAESVPAETLVFGTAIKHIHSLGLNSEMAEVELEDGTRLKSKLLIGADGIHSMVRKATFGDEGLHSTGAFGLWHVMQHNDPKIDAEFKREIDAGGITNMQNGDGYSIYASAIKGIHFWFVSMICDKKYVRIPPKHLIGNGEGYKATCLDIARKADNKLIEKMIQLVDEEDIVPTNLCDRDPLDVFGIGRTMLIGDAAHPFTPFIGQGASQAMVDSFFAGKLIEKHFKYGNLDASAVIDEFNKLRVEPANKLMLFSREIGKLQQSTSLKSKCVFGLARILPSTMLEKSFFSADDACNPNKFFPPTEEEQKRLDALRNLRSEI